MTKDKYKAQNLKKLLFTKVVAYAVYTLNQCPTKATCSGSHKEMWRGRMPCIAHMCVFGNIAYTMIMDGKMNKLDAKIMKYVLLGYCKDIKPFRLICLETTTKPC